MTTTCSKIIANLPLVVEFSLFVKGGSLGIAPTKIIQFIILIIGG